MSDVAEPPDFEATVQSVISNSHGSNLPFGAFPLIEFPQDDLNFKVLPREKRALDAPFEQRLDGLSLPASVKDCLHAYSADYTVFRRKYEHLSTGACYEQLVQDRDVLNQALPQQVFAYCALEDADGSKRTSLASDSNSTGDSATGEPPSNNYNNNRISWTSSNADLRNSPSDAILPGIMERISADDLAVLSRHHREQNRPKNLFLLYPLQRQEDVIERRVLPPLPCNTTQNGLLVDVLSLRMEQEFEPLFAHMALYDAKDRKKVSENFYFDLNSEPIKGMLRAHIPYQDIFSRAKSAVFTLSQVSPELYLVIRLEKVLQPGDISDALEPYVKDEKAAQKMDKLRAAASEQCARLGAYRMPFVWTAVHLTSVLSGASTTATAETTNRASSVLDSPSLFGGGGDPDSGLGTMDRRSVMSSGSCSLKRAGSEKSSAAAIITRRASGRSNNSASLAAEDRLLELQQVPIDLDGFRPMVVTVSNFFKQEAERLSDEDLFKLLADVKKPSVLMKKLKCVPGVLKLELSGCTDDLPNCVSPELLRLRPYTDVNAPPTKLLLEFPSRAVYAPNTFYRNLLYVYPRSVNFASKAAGPGRNIAVRVELRSGETPDSALPNVFGKSSCPDLSPSAVTLVSYHSKSPSFHDEVKIRLPLELTEEHHLLFTFCHVSCRPSHPDPGGGPPEAPIGYTWFPLWRNKRIRAGHYNLPVSLDPLPKSYSYLTPDVNLPGMRWLDNHKSVFSLQVHCVSTIHTQDEYIDKFLSLCDVLASTPARAAAVGEAELRAAILDLMKAKPEPLVRYLHVLLDHLVRLAVNPPILDQDKSGGVSTCCFEMLGQMVKVLTFLLDGFCDAHGRSSLLTSYLEYSARLPTAGHQPRMEGAPSRTRRTVHEAFVLLWLVASGAAREMATSNAWFFLELIVKGMAMDLRQSSRVNLPRRLRYSDGFCEDLRSLVGMLSSEIVGRATRDYRLAQGINTALSFAVRDMLSLMDRTFVFTLVRDHCKQLSAPPKCDSNSNVMPLRLEFLRVLSSHEHFVALNIPFLPAGARCEPTRGAARDATRGARPPSPTLSASSRGSVCSIANSDKDLGPLLLSPEFCARHYFLGLVLGDVAAALDSTNGALQYKAVNVVRNLVTCHDVDPRVREMSIRSVVAQLYLPFLGVVLDHAPRLFDPVRQMAGSQMAKKQEHFAHLGLDPGVAMAIAVGSLGSHAAAVTPAQDPGAAPPQPALGFSTTRNLLLCLVWILKNMDRPATQKLFTDLGPSHLIKLLAVLKVAVSCFEYQSTQLAMREKARGLKTKLEDALIGKSNVRCEFLRNRSLPERDREEKILENGHEKTPERILPPPAGIRWRKEQIQAKGTLERWEIPVKPEREANPVVEGNLATEVTLVVLDTADLVLAVTAGHAEAVNVVRSVLKLLLHVLSCNESQGALEAVFAMVRVLVLRHPWLLLGAETEVCAELCLCLLRHCASPLGPLRSQAAASLYLLMRQSFETGASFSRLKMLVTMSLSSLVGLGEQFNEYCLRKALKTLLFYADHEGGRAAAHRPSPRPAPAAPLTNGHATAAAAATGFSEQVKDLVFNLHMILSDTVKMKEHQSDFEMLIDLMHRIAKGYQTNPDLRITWLLNIAQKHVEKENCAEAAECFIHAAALVAEYLQMRDGADHRPSGYMAFRQVSSNVMEEYAVTEDMVSPAAAAASCESSWFSEPGLCHLLEMSADLFNQASMYEAVEWTYELLLPMYRHVRNYRKSCIIYRKLAECLGKVEGPEEPCRRVFGTYFRVGFYGVRFGDLDGLEYVYKEPAITKLPEISHRLEAFYAERFGAPFVEVIKDSKVVDRATLRPDTAYLQITYCEPYFDQWEARRRPSTFDKFFNVRRFVFATPFTLAGKAHGELAEQFKRKTILTTANAFPYVKTRVQVTAKEELLLSPIEVAIEDVRKKTHELLLATTSGDPKILQMVLQGCIGTTVNQGPLEVARVFLSEPPAPGVALRYRHELRVQFRELTRAAAEALKENKRMTGQQQREYHRELEKNYHRLTERLAPLISASNLSLVEATTIV